MAKYRKRKSTKYLITHCSDTYPNMDTRASDIDEWHRRRGFVSGGYHYIIIRDGSIELGRPDDTIGAHCRAQGRNHDSVGICLIGGKSLANGGPEDNFTPAQKATYRRLVSQLRLKYPEAQVKGHRDFDKHRDCPCFDYEAALNGDQIENQKPNRFCESPSV